MSKKAEKNVIVGVDIGTSKVVTIIGEVDASGRIQIIGVGTRRSRGLKRGVVVNIESTVEAISQATEDAETMAGYDVHSAYTGIAGSHISSLNSHGIVAIRDAEVSPADIERVLDAAKAVAIPADQKIIHVLPQEYIIDNQGGIRDPIGMSGVRLEAKVHMVSGAGSAAQNIVKCVQRCGLSVSDIILEQLASSHAVLTDDEKELGVLLIDIGGGTTDIAVFNDGAIRHTSVIPIAGDQVTNDIAVALRTPTQAAEEIKLRHGCALTALSDPNQMVVVPSVNERAVRQISEKALAEIIEARYEELFSLVLAELKRSGFEDYIASGVVITGGAAKVKGAVQAAEQVFGVPVRLGSAQYVQGPDEIVNNPIYATGIGLLLHGQQQRTEGHKNLSMMNEGVKGVWQRMKGWFQGNF